MSNKKILIVDDEPHIRVLLEQTLEEFEDYDVEILTAKDGQEAIDIINYERPDIVYLDVMMPKMNGFDVCSAVKKQMRIDGVYIVMLSAKGQEFDKQKGIDVGADAYMTKPFDPDAIIKKTSDILGVEL
ncbi:response regulator [Candidatus Magnetoovum chiemensis]|nr:response regulator [Candidatus Magnetoovum chiemensis]